MFQLANGRNGFEPLIILFLILIFLFTGFYPPSPVIPF